MEYKYQANYKGTRYMAVSIEALCKVISKDTGDDIATVKAYVSKLSFVPVSKTTNDKKIDKLTNKKKSKVTLSDAIRGAEAILKMIKGETVSQTEINERARICSNCPKHSKVSGCMSCGFGAILGKFINKLKNFWGGGVQIPKEIKNLYCSCCDCSISIMAPARLERFSEKAKNDPCRPKECWLKSK